MVAMSIYSVCLKCLKLAPILNKVGLNRNYTSRLVYLNLAKKQKPSPEEVRILHARFNDPENVINSVVDILVRIDPVHVPTINLESRLGGQMWHASVSFSWPFPFQVTGVSVDRERALHYAYLEACQMLQALGLVSSSGKIIDWRGELQRAQNTISEKLDLKQFLNYSSSCSLVDERQKWTSKLVLQWPVYLVVVGHGNTQEMAETAAAGIAYIKLKTNKVLSKNNSLVETVRNVRLVLSGTNTFLSNQPQAFSSPDYELWVDASRRGFGAYLISNIESSSTDKRGKTTRWFQEFWPKTINELYVIPKHRTSVTEFYALVCAIYTWKKKFENRTVLVRSDSLAAVNFVNSGLTVNLYDGRGITYLKLFKVLLDTCTKYNIYLRAAHICRDENKAADCLSKLRTEQFFAMVPNASPKAKKTKQLLFFLPLKQTFQTQLKPC